MTYLITITAPAPDPVSPGHEIQHYLRQVDTADIDAVITALDGALKQLPAPRKTRSDAGKPRTQEASK